MHRSYRAAGLDGLAVAIGLILATGLFVGIAQVRAHRAGLRIPDRAPAVAVPATQGPADLSNLQKFEQMLPAHDDIPQALEQLFELAIEERLVLSRGDYRAQNDDAGQFVRYRMSMPLKGSAASVQRFVERALAANRSLVFESVQFKRDRVQAEQVEALVQWTLITGPGGPPMPAAAGEAP
ncbi:hypothetical protein [Variovorax paradoxus]|uniref:hypothetical protein n=1 Tax=Variovorax paradoxus TaxID=34073 RepID=UPI003D646E66